MNLNYFRFKSLIVKNVKKMKIIKLKVIIGTNTFKQKIPV